MQFNGSPVKRKGSILVAALGMVTILTLMVLGFSYAMKVELETVSFRDRETQAIEMARAGIEASKLVLMQDNNEPTDGRPKGHIDYLGDTWSSNATWLIEHDLGDGYYNVSISDECSKFNINKLVPEEDVEADDGDENDPGNRDPGDNNPPNADPPSPQPDNNLPPEETLEKIATLMGLQSEEKGKFRDCMLDWMDPNKLHRINGAEDNEYLKMDPPYLCKNGSFDHLEELLLVKNVGTNLFHGYIDGESGKGYKGLKHFVTVYPIEKMNINTALQEALQILPFMDEAIAGRIVSYRNGNDGQIGTEDDQVFENVTDVIRAAPELDVHMSELENYLDVRSNYFRVKSTGYVGDTKSTITVIMRREGTSVNIVDWREGTAF